MIEGITQMKYMFKIDDREIRIAAESGMNPRKFRIEIEPDEDEIIKYFNTLDSYVVKSGGYLFAVETDSKAVAGIIAQIASGSIYPGDECSVWLEWQYHTIRENNENEPEEIIELSLIPSIEGMSEDSGDESLESAFGKIKAADVLHLPVRGPFMHLARIDRNEAYKYACLGFFHGCIVGVQCDRRNYAVIFTYREEPSAKPDDER